MSKRNKFYLTTPIYYVNARPHIGHAYTTIVADVLARRHRLLGHDTFFLTGTDEHGQKIERSAAAAGVAPQQFADEVSDAFAGLWQRMGITHDKFIRTTDPAHARGVQKLFSTLYQRGHIYLDSYTGAYCVSDEAFVDVPAGDPCPDCGRITETVTEENFFFRLSAFDDRIAALIEANDLLITPDSRRNEVLSFVKRGLKDLSVSRSSFTWGIPVPEPAASAAKEKHVIYVWLDALANYMTAIGYGSDAPADIAQFEKYWPADLHLVGKEIIRFHCVYWPAFLLALNPGSDARPPDTQDPVILSAAETQPYRDSAESKDPCIAPGSPRQPTETDKLWAAKMLPRAITAHGWLLFDNSKMSKSKGNIVRTETVLEAFGEHVYAKQFPDSTKAERDLFAADVLRYFLLREIPFGQDGSFSFDALITRYNADLANGYGNLVSRTLSMIQKYFGGIMPTRRPIEGGTILSELSEPRQQSQPKNPESLGAFTSFAPLLPSAYDVPLSRLFTDLGETDFPNFFQQVANLLATTDRFITDSAPWKLASTPIDRDKLADILCQSANAILRLTVLLYPLIPDATNKVWLQLGLSKSIEEASKSGDLETYGFISLKPGTKLGPLAPIFPRADKGLAQIMTDMEEQNTLAVRSSGPGAESKSDRPEAPLKQAATPTPAQPVTDDPTHPAAPPRTSSLESLAEPSGTLPVGGSHAITTEREVPSHTEAEPSGVFSTAASQVPVSTNPADAAPQIGIDDFAKIELRVAEIKVAERIPKADKLLRLEVDLGYERRQILSGIAEWYAPEDLIGRRIVVITNLAPRKMRGLESHGMLLAASSPGSGPGESGKPILATFAEDIALGSRLK